MTPTGDGELVLPRPDDVTAAAEGDELARRRVLTTLFPVVVRYCRGRLGPGRAADDAADEIGELMSTLLPGDGPGFLARAYRVARDVTDTAEYALDAERPARPARRLQLVPRVAAVTAQLARLPAELRDILVLRVAAGLGVADVATLVGLSPESVRVRQHRALARLRALGEGNAAAGA